jgi:hypothetical protein
MKFSTTLYEKDIKNQEKHIKKSVKEFKDLLIYLKPTIESIEKSEEDPDRQSKILLHHLRSDPKIESYLDRYVGTTDQHPQAYSWRNTIHTLIRGYFFKNIQLTKLITEVEKQAAKGFQAITMAEVQSPLRSSIPELLRDFLPKNIVVEVDKEGKIKRVTDRFENETFNLEEKIARQKLLLKKYNSIVKKVKQDLKSSDEITCLSALVTAIIMETGIRPGNEGNHIVKKVGDEKIEIETFGATTLGPNHIHFIRSNFAKLEFLGKKGSTNLASLSDSVVIKVLKTYTDRSKASGSPFVFVTKEGQTFAYKDLQNYFRKNFDGISPTDFRKLRATETVLTSIRDEQQALYDRIRNFAIHETENLKEKITEVVIEVINRAYKKAQEALSHDNVSTTISAYINPLLVLKFMSQGKIEDKLESAILEGNTVLRFDPMMFLQASNLGSLQKAASQTTSLRDLLERLEGLL